MARVVLAMSGGVDSSVAADLLLQAGHEVIGVFMRHGEESTEVCRVDGKLAGESDAGVAAANPSSVNSNPAAPEPSGDGAAIDQASSRLPVVGQRAGHKQGCCSATDAADARRVAAKMKIPFYALDLQQDFKRIVDYFVDDYLRGRTPNPCVKCNHWIKFGRLFDFADSVEADYVATGHYARMVHCGDRHDLLRGLDSSKDQSYALFGIRPDRLSRMLLPVGDYEKTEIRRRAESLGLGVAGKRDSQEICFVTQGHHSDFVKGRRPDMVGKTAGEIVTTGGKVVGRHDGYEAFTVGQRKGLGVAMGEPYFVTRIDVATKQVVIGLPAELSRTRLYADQANWLIDPSELPSAVGIQIRYNGSPKPGTVEVDAEDSTQFRATFDSPESAVAPGQAAVIYDGPRVIGGGWIVSG